MFIRNTIYDNDKLNIRIVKSMFKKCLREFLNIDLFIDNNKKKRIILQDV